MSDQRRQHRWQPCCIGSPSASSSSNDGFDVAAIDVPVPAISSPHFPTFDVPRECLPLPPLVVGYIRDIESGRCAFETLVAHESIAPEDQATMSMDDDGNVIALPHCDASQSPVGYVWRSLCDVPFVCGITQGVISDHNPHFHPQAEVYYVVRGGGLTLCSDRYVPLVKGQYFYIPGNTIHNTLITHPEGLSVLYWYPNDSAFRTFAYYWRSTVKHSSAAVAAFDEVDRLRRTIGMHTFGHESNAAEIRKLSSDFQCALR